MAGKDLMIQELLSLADDWEDEAVEHQGKDEGSAHVNAVEAAVLERCASDLRACLRGQ